MPGQFIAKDLALLGIAVWSAGAAGSAANGSHRTTVRLSGNGSGKINSRRG